MKALIIISFLVAFLLSTVHFDYQWRWFRPEFAVLLLIYWSMFAPQHFGLISAWLVGLIMDLISLYPLGFHALGALLISYISFLVYRRISNYVFWHQAVWVFVLVATYKLFSNWLGGFFDKTIDSPVFLVSAVFSALLWPLLVALLNHVQTYFRLSNDL
ncbi:MAG: rod shape-determining protein MreD [Cellvibrionaceae bacterium]